MQKLTSYEIPSTWINELKTYLRNLYIAKNHDYGNSAYDTYKYYGDIAILIRIEDKLRRLASLSAFDAEVKDESIEDTYRDAINYVIILAGCKSTEKDNNFQNTLDEFDEVFNLCEGETIVGVDDDYDEVQYLRKHFGRKLVRTTIDKYESYAVKLIRCYYTWCLYSGKIKEGETIDG